MVDTFLSLVSKFCFACLFTVIIIQHLLNVVNIKINVLLNFFLFFHNDIQRLLYLYKSDIIETR